MAAPILSREDIEQIAGRVLSIYTEAYVPERHLCYQVNPEELADVLGTDCVLVPWGHNSCARLEPTGRVIAHTCEELLSILEA